MFSERLFPLILSPQTLSSPASLSRVGVNFSHSSGFDSHCLSSLPPLASSLVVQVVFVQGDRARAAWAGPVPQWWTVGGAAEPKLSPSPSVRIYTPHMLSYGEVVLKSEYTFSVTQVWMCVLHTYLSLSYFSMIFVCIGFKIILNVLLFLVCVCDVSHALQQPEKTSSHSQILCICASVPKCIHSMCACVLSL